MDLELKVLRVIESCETEEQLKAAKKYVTLYFNKYPEMDIFFIRNFYFSNVHNKAIELANKNE